jgi:hypothetical protein
LKGLIGLHDIVPLFYDVLSGVCRGETKGEDKAREVLIAMGME